MSLVPLSDIDADPYYRLLGHRPEILSRWAMLDHALMGKSSKLSSELKEEVRRNLAQDLGCRYCSSLAKPKSSHPDAEEAAALAFAEKVVRDHRAVDAADFEALREHFTDEQIVELCAWICFKFGSNVFGAIMRLDPATPAEIAGYERWVEEAKTR